LISIHQHISIIESRSIYSPPIRKQNNDMVFFTVLSFVYNLLGVIGCAIPNQFFFLWIWVSVSLLRPILYMTGIVTWICQPTATLRKMSLYMTSAQYLLCSQDKKYVLPPIDPASYFETANTNSDPNNNNTDNKNDDDSNDNNIGSKNIIQKKTIIFVRHGESTWNDTFNKGNDRTTLQFVLYFLPNLLYALYMEYYFFLTGQSQESWFYDAPLSPLGIQQAERIQHFLQHTPMEYLTPKEQAMMTLLRGGGGGGGGGDPTTPTTESTTQLISSNLRRAVTTTAIAFRHRVQVVARDGGTDGSGTDGSSSSRNDTILIAPCLQEISCNPDALCITPANATTMISSFTDPISIRHIYASSSSSLTTTTTTPADVPPSTSPPVIDTSLLQDNMSGTNNNSSSNNNNNKSLSSTGLQRVEEFCTFVFTHPKMSATNCCIVVGHSLWFKTFFQRYLPYQNCNHIAKRKKLQNGSVIGCTLLQINTTADDHNNNNSVVPQYQYMIDPTSLVVVHGGF
jgi:hypothetical protein